MGPHFILHIQENLVFDDIIVFFIWIFSFGYRSERISKLFTHKKMQVAENATC